MKILKNLRNDKRLCQVVNTREIWKSRYYVKTLQFVKMCYVLYLQHERPCCIDVQKLKAKARVVYLIQYGRECC